MGHDKTSVLYRVLADIDSLATHESARAANPITKIAVATA